MIRSDKRYLLVFLPLILLILLFAAFLCDHVWADEGYSNSCLYWNANAQNYGGGHILADAFNSSTVRSFLIPRDDGGLMRVHSYKGSNRVLTEYYDEDLNLISSTTRPIGLSDPGTIYCDGDHYYVISGRTGFPSSADKEIIHIVKYDESWKKIGSTGITGFTDILVFDGQPVRVAEIGDYLFIRSAALFKVGHSASCEIVINKETMEVVGDTFNSTLKAVGFTSHCFDSYIAADGNDVVTCEITDGANSGALIKRHTFDPETGNYSISSDHSGAGFILKGNGTYDSYENCCGVSVGGFEISENKYIAVGTTIDQKNISTSRTRNVFLAVADRESSQTFREHGAGNGYSDFADVTMLTSYEEGTGSANTPHLVPMGSDKYLIIWSRKGILYPGDNQSSEGTVYYRMIDGDGNLIGKQYSFKGTLSDCRPIVYNGQVTWYTRAFGMMKFYRINASDISKHSVKNIPLAEEHMNTRIDCFTPATFTKYGYTGYPFCKDCGKNLDTNHKINEFGSCCITDNRTGYTNKLVYTGKKLKPYLETYGSVKEGVDYEVELPAEVKDVGTYSAKVTLTGNYTGSKTIKFKVIPANPKCTFKALKRKIRIAMNNKASAYGADRFQIRYRMKGKSWKTVETSSTKKVLKKLKKGKAYNIKVRSCRTLNGKTYYSTWRSKTVKVK